MAEERDSPAIVVELTVAAIRVLLNVAVVYALTQIARAALNRLESLLVRASEVTEKEPGPRPMAAKVRRTRSGSTEHEFRN